MQGFLHQKTFQLYFTIKTYSFIEVSAELLSVLFSSSNEDLECHKKLEMIVCTDIFLLSSRKLAFSPQWTKKHKAFFSALCITSTLNYKPPPLSKFCPFLYKQGQKKILQAEIHCMNTGNMRASCFLSLGDYLV